MSQVISGNAVVEGSLDLTGHELLQAVLDKTTGALTAQGQVGYDVTSNRPAVHDGVATKVMAFLEDVTRLGRPKGVIDASLGLLPTNTDGDAADGNADLDDFWRVSVAGTITGLGALKVGDVIYANKDNPTVAADFDVVPFPIDFVNAFENGLSVDGTSGKAGLGGTLVRDTTIQGAHFVEVKNTAGKTQLSLKNSASLSSGNPVNNQSSLVAGASDKAAQVNAFTGAGYAAATLWAQETALGLESAIVSAELEGIFLRANNGKKVHIEYDESAIGDGFLVAKNGTGEVGIASGTVSKAAKATINLAAGTPLPVTFSSLTEVYTFQVRDSSGNHVIIPAVCVPGTNVVTLISSTAYTGAVIYATGV